MVLALLGRCAVLAVFWVVWTERKKIIFVEARCEDVDLSVGEGSFLVISLGLVSSGF